MDIEGDGFHLMIHVEINGSPAHLLLDTGASKSVLDLNRVSRFADPMHFTDSERLSTGLGTNTMQSQQTILENIKLGEIILQDYEMVLLDLNHVNESYEKLGIEAIDGVIGSDILKKFNAVINFEKLTLELKEEE